MWKEWRECSVDYFALRKAPIRSTESSDTRKESGTHTAVLTPARSLRASCTVLRATLPDSEPQRHGVLTTP